MSERKQKRHELKTDPDVFDAVAEKRKTFEIRYDDRNYQVGDRLVLRKTLHSGDDMKLGKPLKYLDEETVLVTYILRGPRYGLADGWVIMGIKTRADLAAKRGVALRDKNERLEADNERLRKALKSTVDLLVIWSKWTPEYCSAHREPESLPELQNAREALAKHKQSTAIEKETT